MNKHVLITWEDHEFPDEGAPCRRMSFDKEITQYASRNGTIHIKKDSPGIICCPDPKINDNFIVITPDGIIGLHRYWLRTYGGGVV